MSKYYFKVKASNDDDFNVGVIEAETKTAALDAVKEIYGAIEHTSIIEEKEFKDHQTKVGKNLTHKIEDVQS